MLHWLYGAFTMMYKEAYKRKCEPTLVLIQMVGLRLPCIVDKKKQLTPLAIYVDTYNKPKEERPLLIPAIQMSCRSSPFWNKAKTLPIICLLLFATIQR